MRIEKVRSGLGARLRDRRDEIEQAILTRVHAVSEPVEISDPEYAHGLRDAVSAALDYGLDALERSEERPLPIPAVLLAQARLAARGGVSLDTVLRRYLVGYTLLSDFVIREAEKGDMLRGSSISRLLRAQAALFDRVVAAVSEEYGREEKGFLRSAGERRADHIRRLLAGELLDTTDLGYDLGIHHLGIIAIGAGAIEAVRSLPLARSRALLSVCNEEGRVWAWVGSKRSFGSEELGSLASADWPPGITVAIGEPAEGIAGWRLTHRQAAAALPIAVRCARTTVRYADVALLASMLRDELLTTSLRELFLAPLEQDRDGGAVLGQTLRAYFAAGRNASSAASALGVSRRTVTNRLRITEERLGRSVTTDTVEIEAALRLREMDEFSPA